MRKNHLKIIVVLLMILSPGLLKGQINIENIGLAPNTAAFARYGEIPVDLSRGIPNIQIPLYDLDVGGGNTLPISLSYHASGIRVSDVASWVGLGWSLNVGGSIAVNVQGRPGDPKESEKINSAYANKNLVSAFGEQILNTYRPFVWDPEPAGEVEDMQPDIYYYNYPGGSGKFAGSRNADFALSPMKDIKIIPEYTDPLHVTSLQPNSFQILDEKGVNYKFNALEKRALALSGLYYINSYKLSEINYPDLIDDVKFTYESSNFNVIGKNESYSFIRDYNTYIYGSSPLLSSFPEHVVKSNDATFTASQILREVSVGSNLKVKFHSSQSSCYCKCKLDSIEVLKDNVCVKKIKFNYTEQKRMFLSKVDVGGEHYSFDYYEGLPDDITSYSQDLWGYYNGIANKNFLPYGEGYPLVQKAPNKYDHSLFDIADRIPSEKFAVAGTLRKITYPTGGVTEFEFEGNIARHSGFDDIGPISSEVWNVRDDKSYESFIYRSHETKREIIPFRFDSSLDEFREIDNRKIWSFPPSYLGPLPCEEFTLRPRIEILNKYSRPDLTSLKFFDFRFKIEIVDLSKEPASVIFSSIMPMVNPFIEKTFKAGPDVLINYHLELELKDPNIMPPEEFRMNCGFELDYTHSCTTDEGHKYGGLRVKKIISRENPNEEESLIREYKYLDNELTSGQCNTKFNIIQFKPTERAYYKSSQGHTAKIYDPNDFNTGTLRYIGVNSGNSPAVGAYDGGIVIYKKVEECVKSKDGKQNGKNIYHYSHFDKYSDWKNGKLLKREIYDSENLIREENYSYNFEDERVRNNPLIGIRFFPSMSSLPDGPGFNHSESDIAKCILPIFDEYHNNWVYKTRDSIINYLPNGKSLTEVSHYSYDNPSHLQLTKKTTVNSKGDKIENKYYYPGDEAQLGGYSPTELSAINLLKGSELHKTSSLLQAETYCNDVKMQVVKNCYKDWGNNHVLLERVLESKQGDNLKEKQKVIKYDKNSNVNEIADASGIRTVVLWGYDYKYPVAKIINSTYADVMGYLGRSANDDLNYLQVMSSDQLKVELNKIRNNAGSSQVSTYTYAPLIGLTSETDPNGITTYYEYDNFGRLEYVKDDEGNILKKNEYYYKTN